MTHVKIHYTLNYNKEVAYEKNQFNLLIIAIWLCAFYSKLCRPRHRYKRGGIAGYGPGYDPNDPIDAKYPYWRVTIKDFGCSNGTTCTWTVDEKKAAIKMMARLRAMLNIPEFQDVFRQNAPYIADEVESYEGSPYSTTTGEAYDTERLLWSILNADFEVKIMLVVMLLQMWVKVYMFSLGITLMYINLIMFVTFQIQLIQEQEIVDMFLIHL